MEADIDVPPEAAAAMQRSALAAISAKAGNRIPIVRGPDRGLPKVAPIFDLDQMRKKNAEVLLRQKGPKGV